MGRTLEHHLPVELLPSAAVYVDTRGVILAANTPFQQLWSAAGYGAPSPAGAGVLTLFAEDDRDALRHRLGSTVPARPSVLTAALAGSGGKMAVELVPVPSGRRRPQLWLLMLRPAPAERRSEGMLQQALAAGLFHDLRAPLQVVLGWTMLLKRKHEDERRLEHALTVIERNARVQLDLLDQLLELAQPPWARAPLRRVPVDLAELVTAVVRSLEPMADERGVRLALAVEGRAIVSGHAVHLRRIVTNLVMNALKFTPAGGRVECRLSAATSARLVISDSGRGIRPELLPRVFEPFIQEPDFNPGQDGVGLGLCVVRHLVELHGGQVMAESSGAGLGATFTVLLPVAPPVPARGVLPSYSRSREAC